MAQLNKINPALTGYGEVLAVLNDIPKEMKAKILGVAVTKAAAPSVRAAKKHAAKSRRTGALQKSIRSRTKTYPKNATAVAIIGPDRGRYGAGKRLKKGDDARQSNMPAKYAHLVEFGHLTARGGKLRDTYETEVSVSVSANGRTTRRRRKTDRIKARATGEVTGFVLPQPFMRPAFAETKGQMEDELVKGVGVGIERVRRKRIKSGTYKA